MKKISFLGLCFILAGLTLSPVKADSYDIFVNQASSSETQDGSQENPYKTIAAAITAAKEKPSDQRHIFISNGTYMENLILDSSVSLTGESNTSTIINGIGSSKTIEIDKTSSLSRLHIINGHEGVYISPGAGAEITSCKIENAQKIGIAIIKSSTSNSEKVTVSNSDISSGDGKGFYINKRKVEIVNNNISNNEEEGIDIRAGVKGSIKKNTISKNGESGIELIVGSSSLKITSNKIKGNSANGIANQFYKESKGSGKITLTKNRIQSNDDYGVQCTAPSGGKSPKNYWTKSIDLARNIFSKNKTPIAKRCGFPIALKK